MDPRELLSWDGWGLSEAPFLAGVISGWPDESQRPSLAASLLDGMREAVEEVMPGVVPNDGGEAALLEEMAAINGGVLPSWASRGNGPRPRARGWSRLLERTRRVDAYLDGYVNAPRPASTGVRALDELLGGGVYPGLNVLMASPGAGKTALAVQMLASNAIRGGNSLMFSLEMSEVQVKMRVASWLSMKRLLDARSRGEEWDGSPVPWSAVTRIADSSWEHVDWERASEVAPEATSVVLGALNGKGSVLTREQAIDAVGDPGLVSQVMRASGDQMARAMADAERSVFPRMAVLHEAMDASAITSEVRASCEELGRPPLVVVDYLQIVRGTPDAERLGETEVTKQVSDELARCAADTGAPILCVAAKRKGGDSGMESARGSGAIAYNAQSVAHITGHDDEEPVDGRWRHVTLEVTKNRSAGVGKRELWFDGRHNLFSGAEEPPDATYGGGE